MTVEAGGIVTLHPGDVALGTRGDVLETLLGSCVAIVLTDPRRTVGVMSHIVHAGRGSADGRATAHHGEVALATMQRLLRDRGLAPRLCEAYVYGGGNMFPQLGDEASNVGDDNADWALRTLQRLGIRVLEAELRGTCYRRLRWTVGPEAPQVQAVPL